MPHLARFGSAAYSFCAKLLLAVMLVNSLVPQAWTLTDHEKELYDRGIYYYYSGISSTEEDCSEEPPGNGGDVLDGHRLPAIEGGWGKEQNLPTKGDGRNIEQHVALTDGDRPPEVDRNKVKEAGMTPKNGAFGEVQGPKEEQWYITMRWRYVRWFWNGSTSGEASEAGQSSWYRGKKILVTNPATGKSIVASVQEAGPAPWVGTVSNSSSQKEPGWNQPQEGTPGQQGNPGTYGDPNTYTGRVSGLSPEGYLYLGAQQWVHGGPNNGGSGHSLRYEWADQSARLGPTDQAATPPGEECVTNSSGDLGFIKEVAFPDKKTKITPTAIVLHYTANPNASKDATVSSLRGNKTCGEQGCSVQLTTDGEGKTYQLVDPLNVVTDHAKGINDRAIGNEIGGANEAQLLANDVQYNEVIRATMKLMQFYKIPLQPDAPNRRGVLGHYETDAQPYGGHSGKVDPGTTYMDNVRQEIARRQAE